MTFGRSLSVLLLVCLSGCAADRPGPATHAAPRADDARLVAALDALCESFEGRVGLYVHHVATGSSHSHLGDEVLPTASLVKVPILLALYGRIERGELDPHAELTYEKSRSRGGEDLMAAFEEGTQIGLSKLIHLMIAFSDNTASLWLQEIAGGGAGVNDWLAQHGFEHTRVNSRTKGRETNQGVLGWGETTPREMAELLLAIREGRAVSPRADEEMYRVLCRSFWDSEALSQIPPWVQAASKQGAVSRSRSEVVLVNGPHGDYVFCVITNDQTDTSWSADNAGFVLLRAFSRLLWEHFEGADFVPADGVEVWR